MADLSKLTVGGQEYNFKDAQAREDIAALESKKVWLGITTTALTDGATTNPIEIEGEEVTAVSGDWCAYGQKEFVFNGTAWQELGDLSDLGDLAHKDSASGTYTPQGTIGAQTVTVTPQTTSVEGIATVGTLPSFTVSGETLTLDAGTLPTKATAVQVMTGASASVDTATFTGTQATIEVE